MRTIRVIFCWAEASGYMAACWRALANRPGIDLHILHPKQLWGKTNPFLSEPSLFEGISNEMFDADKSGIDQWLVKAISSQRPDVIVLCGWIYPPYSRAVNSPVLKKTPVVIGMDSPWRGTFFQRLARFRLSALARRASLVVTAGERSREYALRIGIPDSRIRMGYYGFDYQSFRTVAETRLAETGAWPRQFLFVGRYVAQKDLSTLVRAYSAYRESVTDPWGLTCCGTGPDESLLKGVKGIVDVGFIQPKELPQKFRSHGTFVLPSRFEPWGVVLAEAAASGLPLICSTACGAGVDLVRSYYNGLLVAPQDVDALTRAMRWMHEHESELPEMGRRGQALAEAFSAEVWATRWHNYFLETIEQAE